MIYQDVRDDHLSLGEDVTELVFLASLSPTLFLVAFFWPSLCCLRAIAVQPKGWRVRSTRDGRRPTLWTYEMTGGPAQGSGPST